MAYGYPIWQKEKFPAWVVYLLYGLLLFLFIVLWPMVQREFFSPHPERPPAHPNEWIER